MDNIDLSLWRSANLWLVPVLYLSFALLARLAGLGNEHYWKLAKLLGLAGLSLAALALAQTVLFGAKTVMLPGALQVGTWGTITFHARADLIGNLFMVMVNLIGWIIIGFSQRYLSGESGQRRYVISLLVTLAAVNVVVISNNMIVLALAWVLTSIALHSLLTFYPLRTQAIFAAHKKFIVSRIADVCLFIAIGIIAHQTGSLELDQIAATISTLPALNSDLQIAAVLLALTAALKCAQLPFHGWLIQVMEAPTPVSALLHAGVVNLGGFLLIRFSFLMVASAPAQLLLVFIGAITAVCAALVMMTRISIKVSLAWSTCAQMGFMLMQCGLGVYELAALHLLAHSLYKAYAFLNSGSTNARLNLKAGQPDSLGLGNRLLSGGAGLTIVFVLFYLIHPSTSVGQPLFAFAVIIALALAPLLSFNLRGDSILNNFKFVGYAAALVLVYLALHRVFADHLGVSVTDHAGWMTLRVGVVVALFVGLYLLQSVVLEKTYRPLFERLYPMFFGGFYLDDLFTRLTFWIWPAPLKNGTHQPSSRPSRSV